MWWFVVSPQTDYNYTIYATSLKKKVSEFKAKSKLLYPSSRREWSLEWLIRRMKWIIRQEYIKNEFEEC